VSGAAIGGVVLDVAALRSFAAREDLYAESVVWACVDSGDVILVPSIALAETRAGLPTAHLEVLAVLVELPNTVIAVFDAAAAGRCAELLARLPADHRGAVSAAQAVAEAVDRGWPVVTDRAELLAALDHRVLADPLP
jgi:hypothetical protein